MSGVFIAFEGGEGAGKSTQAVILKDTLCRQGLRATLLNEPGSTPAGDYLRQYLVSDRPISPAAELLLFEASRAELVAERVLPDVAAGAVVVCDRFAGSTIAYQGYGRGLDLAAVEWLNDFATGCRYPDLTILLDIDPVIGLTRVNSRLLQLALPMGDAPDRFEDEAMAFHDRVRRGFLKQADANPQTWRRIDGSRSIEAVAGEVWGVVSPLLAVRDLRREGV